MTEINNQQYTITVISPYTFSIGDTRGFSLYQREGLCEQVKIPKKIEFKSFSDSLINPYAPERNDLDMFDWEKFGRPELLHIVYNALLEFVAQNNNKLPELNNEEHANKLLALTKQINESDRGKDALKAEIDDEIVKNVARYARA